MKTKIIKAFLPLTFLLSMIGCNKLDHCAGYLCMPPPYAGISFKVYNAGGENLITNGTLTVDNITLVESGGESAKPVIPDDKTAFIFGFWEGERNYTMTLDKSEFELKVTVSRTEKKNGECCSGFQVDSFIMNGQQISIPISNMIEITI